MKLSLNNGSIKWYFIQSWENWDKLKRKKMSGSSPHIIFRLHLNWGETLFFNFFSLTKFIFLWNLTGYWIFKGRENGSKCGPNWNVDQVVLGENMQSGCQRHWCIGKADENDLLTLVHLFQFHSLFSFPFTFLKKAYTHDFCCLLV